VPIVSPAWTGTTVAAIGVPNEMVAAFGAYDLKAKGFVGRK
jgi:hypothetical protein